MENFLLSFNLVFPIFLLLALGFILRKLNIFDKTTTEKVNKAVFKAFLPTSIFFNVLNSDINDVFDPSLIGYGVLSVLVCFAALFLLVSLFCKDRKKRGVLIQGIYRSNFLIFGLPVAQNLYKDGSLSGKASVLIAIIVPVFNLLAVFVLETFKKGKTEPGKVAKGIITNPLIIGSALGFVFLFLKTRGIVMPKAVLSAVSDVSKMASPLALVALGASIDFSTVLGNFKYITWGVLGKLVLSPAVFLAIAVLFGFRDRELAILLAMYATPPAVSSYTMAQQMGADDELAAQLVVFGTAVSIFTVFLWVLVITSLGFINPIG